ncbi:MAG TPA: outer membrane lipoprotein carrier protein LolA [Nitrospirae bacterium]|nr:outer membrane lipoprotein carrier protein LolA [Nitrospirota bacterium]
MKNLIFRVALLLLLFLSSPVSIFGASDLEEIIGKVQESFDRTRAMTAEFTQETTNKGFGKTMFSYGVVTIVKPLKMRWDYKKPAGLLLVADGKKLWYFDPEDNVAYFDSLSGYLHPRSPALFLAGDEPLSSIFNIELASGGKNGKLGLVSFKLSPKEPQPGVKAILLTVDDQTYEIREIVMVDYLGNKNSLTFTNVNRTASPDMSIFRFEPPAGAQVRSMTKIPGG